MHGPLHSTTVDRILALDLGNGPAEGEPTVDHHGHEDGHEVEGALARALAGHQLLEQERIDKFYLSHLNYAGRGNNNRAGDNAELAVFAIDEALLELQGNSTWKLLEAMMKRRDYGMTTATAQMQVIGKRHFGRKALPPGGSGGRGAGTRR